MSNTEWIQTFSGFKFDLIEPDPDSIDIFDISHSLSNKCRFGGHTNRFYSVAEHSILLSELIITDNIYLKLIALLHDAEEAYTGDVTQPLKALLDGFSLIAGNIRRRIFKKFDIAYPGDDEKQLIKDIEYRLILTERKVLLSEPPEKWHLDYTDYRPYNNYKKLIKCLDPETAREKFIYKFYYLWHTYTRLKNKKK